MYMLLFVSFLTTLFSCGHIWTIVGRRGQTSWLPRRQERPLLMKKSTRPSLNSNRSDYIYIYTKTFSPVLTIAAFFMLSKEVGSLIGNKAGFSSASNSWGDKAGHEAMCDRSLTHLLTHPLLHSNSWGDKAGHEAMCDRSLTHLLTHPLLHSNSWGDKAGHEAMCDRSLTHLLTHPLIHSNSWGDKAGHEAMCDRSLTHLLTHPLLHSNSWGDKVVMRRCVIDHSLTYSLTH